MMYAIEMSDGTVEIMQTVGSVKPDACIAKWSERERNRVVSHKRIDPSAVPADRTFRNAWKINGDRIDHDMPKARTIHLERMRAARTPVFAKLDADWMKATGQKDTATADAIEAERQKLRDIPQTIATDLEKAGTPEALKEVWPDVLPALQRK